VVRAAGRLFLLETGERSQLAGQVVGVVVDGRTQPGRIIVAPGYLLQEDGLPTATLAEVSPVRYPSLADQASEALNAHPASCFPVIGERLAAGRVVKLDIPAGTATVQTDDGERILPIEGEETV